MKNHIKGSDLYLMESNHDVNMLKNGAYPWPLKQRILSENGHLSNDYAGSVLGEVISGNKETILLGHLSKDNNTPDLAHRTVKEILVNKGIDVDSEVTLDLTYRDKITKVYNL